MASQDVDNPVYQFKILPLEHINPLDNELGRGAYGRVFTFTYQGSVYAPKEIHSLLLDGVSSEEKKLSDKGCFFARMSPLQFNKPFF